MNAKRILLVDDDATALMAVGKLLRREHYEVTTCSESTEGVSLALRKAWDLVVLDLDVGQPRPGTSGDFDGLTLLRWIRAADRTTPAVLLTASESGGLDDRAESAGATRVVRKSDPPQRLLEVARAALETARESSKTPVPSKQTEEVGSWIAPPVEAQRARAFFELALARLRAAVNVFF